MKYIKCLTSPRFCLGAIYFFLFGTALVGVDLFHSKLSKFIFCPFHLLTGLMCPGCGMTRAFIELSKFHIFEAIRLNPLSPLVFCGGLAWILFHERTERIHFSRYFWLVSVIGVLAFGVLRNL